MISKGDSDATNMTGSVVSELDSGNIHFSSHFLLLMLERDEFDLSL